MNSAAWSVAVAAVLFASAGVAVRLAPADAPAALLGVVRLLIGGGALAAMIGPGALRAALHRSPWSALAQAALAMALFQWSFFAAIAGSGVAVASLVSAGASPFFVDAYASACRRLWPAPHIIWSAGIAAPALLLLLHDNVDAPALFAAIVSAAAYAVYVTAAARLERAHAGDGIASTTLALLIGGAILLPAAASAKATSLSLGLFGVAAYLGIVATALAYGFFLRGLRGIAPGVALAILTVQPLAAILAGATVLSEPLSASTLAASVIFALALVIRMFAASHVQLKERMSPCQ